VKRVLPSKLRPYANSVRRLLRRATRQRKLRITLQDLVDDLSRVGLQRGGVVIVHSSLSKIGHVEGGGDTVIDALLQVLGPDGTLVMPSFPFDTYVEDYLEVHREFDAKLTPSRMGKITELFRQRPGVLRSLHPTHPVAALGPQAEALTASHHLDILSFGRLSPFFRLCEQDGWILLLGVDYHTMTNLHVVEDCFEAFPYAVYADKRILVKVRDSGGKEQGIEFRPHAKSLSSLRDCNKMERYFDAAGILRRGRVGEAEARLLNGAGVLRVMTDLARRGITMYVDEHVPPQHRKTTASHTP